MDKVLKQNAGVEKQLEQIRQDERKYRQQVNQLTARVEELETALESAHRQSKRLAADNDKLLEQIDMAGLELRSLRDKGIGEKYKHLITLACKSKVVLLLVLDHIPKTLLRSFTSML